MRKKTSFTIINRPFDNSASREKIEAELLDKLRKQIKEARPPAMIPPGLMEAMVTSLPPGSPAKKAKGTRNVDIVGELPPDLVDTVRRLSTQPATATTVGILDLGAWVSGLPDLLKRLNKAQSRYTFLEVHTAVPSGLIKTKEPLVAWAEKELGRHTTQEEKSELVRNMLADEFFYFADSVRRQHKLDYIFGLTPAMIAFADNDGPKMNYFAWGKDRVAVLSTCDLREFASEAGRPYEAAVGMLIVTQTIVKCTPLRRHKETHQCVFDFNTVRAGLIDSIRTMQIHDNCLQTLEKSSPEDASATLKLIRTLSKMKVANRG